MDTTLATGRATAQHHNDPGQQSGEGRYTDLEVRDMAVKAAMSVSGKFILPWIDDPERTYSSEEAEEVIRSAKAAAGETPERAVSEPVEPEVQAWGVGHQYPNGRPDVLGTKDSAVWIYWKTILDPDLPIKFKAPPHTLKTLAALRGHWAGNGSSAWPSAERLAREIGCHRNTVVKDLKELQAHRLLRRVPRFKKPEAGHEWQPTLPHDSEVDAIASKWFHKNSQNRYRSHEGGKARDERKRRRS